MPLDILVNSLCGPCIRHETCPLKFTSSFQLLLKGLLGKQFSLESCSQIIEKTRRIQNPVHSGMILSSLFLEVISVNYVNILAAFFVSDFKLGDVGLFIVPQCP